MRAPRYRKGAEYLRWNICDKYQLDGVRAQLKKRCEDINERFTRSEWLRLERIATRTREFEESDRRLRERGHDPIRLHRERIATMTRESEESDRRLRERGIDPIRVKNLFK